MDIELCKRMAAARPSAKGGFTLGKDLTKALARGPRWLPRLAGRFVTIGARYGYKTRDGAIRAATEYRRRCRVYLDANGDGTEIG